MPLLGVFMNLLLLIATVLNLFIVIGHFSMGKKLYLLPMLETDMDDVVKKIMHSLFHYSSVFLTTSALILFYSLINTSFQEDNIFLLLFISSQFILNALVQLLISFTSQIKNPLMKLFQWTLFLATGILIILGIC